MSGPVVGTKSGGSSQTPIVAGTRPGMINLGFTVESFSLTNCFIPFLAVSSSVSVGGGVASGSSRTYLVTTQAPPSTIIPVAKVLPQPIVSTASAMGSSVSKSKCFDFFYFKTHFYVRYPLATMSVTSSNVSSTSSSNESQGTGTTSAGATTGVYLHATSRPSTGMHYINMRNNNSAIIFIFLNFISDH